MTRGLRETSAPNAEGEVFMSDADAAELGFEVLVLAELFYDPRIAFAMDCHGALRKRQRRIIAPQM